MYKEAPSPSRENSRSYESSSASGDALRRSLLASPESRGGEFVLPESTIAIRLNSHNLSEQSIANLSKMVNTLQEYDVQGDGYGKLQDGEMLSSLDHKAKADRESGDTFANVTLLYDKATRAENDETHIPSAAIVHETMSEENIRRLREVLPYGVPIIDGQTNELLDDVGSAERHMSREVNAIYHDLGGMAFHASRMSEAVYNSEFDDIITHFTDEYKYTPYNSRHETLNDVWANPAYFASGGYEPRSNASAKTERPAEEPAPLLPESEEVRAYRTKEAMEQVEVEAHAENDRRNIHKASDAIFDAAKELYDVADLGGLDDRQLRKVERKVQGRLHPDRGFDNGGDIGAFKEAGVLMDKVREHNAATAGDSEAE